MENSYSPKLEIDLDTFPGDGDSSAILIVDDEAITREVLGALLTPEGYELVFASSGAEALEKAVESMPDLILLDIQMPDMDGFEVCQRLRADSLLAEVPIVMITGLYDRATRLRGIESGADNFIGKPFDSTELLAHVRTITRLNRYRKLIVVKSRLEKEVDHLSALYNISSALNYITDMDSLLRLIAQQTKTLLDVERASIIFHDPEKDELYFPAVAAEGYEAATWLSQFRFPANCGIAGWVLSEGEPALVHDVNVDKRFHGKMDENTGFVTKSILCVPLHGKQGIIGVIEAVNKKSGEFSEDDQGLLETMADNIAISIEKANMHQELQESDTLLRDQNAQLAQSVEALQNEISEREKAEKSLIETHEELNKMQEQLVQSEKLAALGRFSAGISHEIKNPLAIILSGMEFLQIKLPNADTSVKTAIEKIKNSVLRADKILRNLLDFARPSESKFERLKPCDLINDTLSFFRYSAPLKNIDLKAQLPEEDIYIEIDKTQIQQVLFNLLMNSVDAMSDGGEIKVKGYETVSSEGKPFYAIEIMDTGEGISKDNLSRLFEPFYTTKRDSKGTGLGLSISRTIVNGHGGDLTIDSEWGKGTIATVMLPFAQGEAE